MPAQWLVSFWALQLSFYVHVHVHNVLQISDDAQHLRWQCRYCVNVWDSVNVMYIYDVIRYDMKTFSVHSINGEQYAYWTRPKRDE